MKKLIKKLMITITSIIMFLLSPVLAHQAPNNDTNISYANQFFNQYCDFHEAFHSFFSKETKDYESTPLSSWKQVQNKLQSIYSNLLKLEPTPQFENAHNQFLFEYKQLLDELNKYVTNLEINPKTDFLNYFKEIAKHRQNLSSAYRNVFEIFQKWPKKDRDKVNTEEMMQKWERMEHRKKLLFQNFSTLK